MHVNRNNVLIGDPVDTGLVLNECIGQRKDSTLVMQAYVDVAFAESFAMHQHLFGPCDINTTALAYVHKSDASIHTLSVLGQLQSQKAIPEGHPYRITPHTLVRYGFVGSKPSRDSERDEKGFRDKDRSFIALSVRACRLLCLATFLPSAALSVLSTPQALGWPWRCHSRQNCS